MQLGIDSGHRTGSSQHDADIHCEERDHDRDHADNSQMCQERRGGDPTEDHQGNQRQQQPGHRKGQQVGVGLDHCPGLLGQWLAA